MSPGRIRARQTPRTSYSDILDACNLFGEIHTAWMIRRYPEQERIEGFAALSPAERQSAVVHERKLDLAKAALRGGQAVKVLARNYAKTSRYTHLTHRERVAILRSLADRIASWPDAVLFADAQRKSS